MFLENNQNRSAGNTESIWVMQFQYNTVGGGTNSDDWTRRAWNPQYHAIDGFALADSLGGRGLAQIYPLKWWIGVKGTNATTAGEKEGFPDNQRERYLRRRRHPQFGVQHQAQLVLQQPADAQQTRPEMPHRRQIVVAGPAFSGAEKVLFRKRGEFAAHRFVQGPHEIPPG